MLLTQFLDTQGSAWELQQAAQSLGLPAPPVLKLPPLPPATTACDLAALTTLLGPLAASALRTQLATSAVADELTADLEKSKSQLQSYLALLNGLITSGTAEQYKQILLTGTTEAAQTTLANLQGTLGDATVTQVAAACPAAGYLLGLAGTSLDNAQAVLASTAALQSALVSRLDGLVGARDLALGLLAEVQARLDALPDLLAVFSG